MRQIWWAALLVAVSILTGCGGSSQSGTAPVTTPLQLDIAWAARSRGVDAPSSARSAVIVLERGDAETGGPVQLPTIDRQDSPAAYTQNYRSPKPLRTGPNLIVVTFYANKGATGAVVGTASKSITLAADGTGAGTIALVGKVQKVAVTGFAQIAVGEETTLGVSATDGNNATVAISPGSATFSLLSGNSVLSVTADGKLTGLAVGKAMVQARVDGKTSAPFEVTVVPTGNAAAVIAAGQSVALGESKKLDFSFTDGHGTPILVDPAQITFEITRGSDVASVTNDGTLTGLKLGTVTLKVKIPGLESDPTTVAVTAPVASVEIPALQSVGVGETKPVTVVVKNAAGEAIPVGTDGLRFTFRLGSDKLHITDGSATGDAAGFAVVQATAGDVVSTAQAVFVGTIATTASGLKTLDLTVGSGALPVKNQTATIDYTGWLLDGTQFDSSRTPGRQPFSFKVGAGSVIKGFDEGVLGTKVGGRRLLIIPPDLGYGAGGSPPSIPGNATLIFDIELLGVE